MSAVFTIASNWLNPNLPVAGWRGQHLAPLDGHRDLGRSLAKRSEGLPNPDGRRGGRPTSAAVIAALAGVVRRCSDQPTCPGRLHQGPGADFESAQPLDYTRLLVEAPTSPALSTRSATPYDCPP